jgi:transcriptional regulator with XRE-family HTH domain
VTVISGKHHKIDFTFAQRLEIYMRECNLYPAELARLLGMRRQQVEKYLSGVAEPRASTVRYIAERLNVSADLLLGVDLKKATQRGQIMF